MLSCRSAIFVPLGLSLFLALALPACSLKSGTEGQGAEQKETYYFDAELAFALAYPSDWKLERGKGQAPESCTVRWQSTSGPEVRAEVVACPAPPGRKGFDEMRGEFLTLHPDLAVTREEWDELPAGPGLLIEGNDPARAYLAVMLATEMREYTVAFSAPRADFERYRPTFEAIIASFQPLDEG